MSQDSPTLNSPQYWDMRFETDWEDRGGPDQTAFFARLALEAMPRWLAEDIRARRLSILDVGCAMGDALPLLQGAFPASKVSGAEASQSAVDVAGLRHLGYQFALISEGQPPPPADVVFTSNVIEHFDDWPEFLRQWAQAARMHLIVLAPFAEPAPLIDEHCTSFLLDTLPAEVGELRLASLAVFDAASLPGSRWPGGQFMAVYSSQAAQGLAVSRMEPEVALDLRGLDAGAVEAVVRGAEAIDAVRRTALATMAQHVNEQRSVVADLRAAVAHVEAQADAQHAELKAQADAQYKAFEAQRSALETQAENLQAALAEMLDVARVHHLSLGQAEHALNDHVEALRTLMSSILGSSSWSVTAPLRRVVALFRRRQHAPILVPAPIRLQLPRLELAPALLRLAQPKRIRLPPYPHASTPPAVTSPTAPSQLPGKPLIAADGRRVMLCLMSLDRGGLEQVVVDLAVGFAELGHQVTVAVTRDGGDCSRRLEAAGIAVHVLEEDAARFADLVGRLQPEFVFTHHSYFGLDALRAAGAAIWEVVHNYYVWHKEHLENYRSSTQAVNGFIAVSSGVADFHSETFGIPREDIMVVNNPMNPLDLIRPERALLARLRQDHAASFRFVNIAQFYPAKAHQLLLSAFIEVHSRHPQARLRLIGQHINVEVSEAITRRIAAEGLEDVVEMTGFVDRRQLSHFLATSHVFVQPSVYEGYSVAMAEAAHFALPLILTRVGGAFETVREEDAGILISPHVPSFSDMPVADIFRLGLDPYPHNLPELVAAMERMLLDYPDWAERGFVGQARVDEHTPHAVAQRYMELARPLEPKRIR